VTLGRLRRPALAACRSGPYIVRCSHGVRAAGAGFRARPGPRRSCRCAVAGRRCNGGTATTFSRVCAGARRKLRPALPVAHVVRRGIKPCSPDQPVEPLFGRPNGTSAGWPASAGRVGLGKTTHLRAPEPALARPARALQLLSPVDVVGRGFHRTLTEAARYHEVAPGGSVEEAAACRSGA
jgi:hypothetical protein